MNKKKRNTGRILIVSCAVGCVFIIALQTIFLVKNPFIFRITTMLQDKDEMFQFVLDNQDELEKIVSEIEKLYKNQSENIIVIDMFSYDEYKFTEADKYIRKYKITFISVEKTNESYEVNLLFDDPPPNYTYWGIYYMENGQPGTWGEGELVEKDGVYTQTGSYYQYETEKITDNWYFYQCDTR